MRTRRGANVICSAAALLFIVLWATALIWTASSIDDADRISNHAQQPQDATQNVQRDMNSVDTISGRSAFSDDDIAIEIPGIELKLQSQIPDPIQVVYANSDVIGPPKGLVLLLHACSHSALKFFSPSPSCPNCVGLSEELRIVRLVMKQGYVPVAVSSINRNNGCWSSQDVPRIEAVLRHDFFQQYQDDAHSIFGIGASSGGAFAAELASKKMVQGALVMVMSLSGDVVNKLQKSPVPIYLAPMPRDKNTLKQATTNYRDLDSVRDFVVLDRTSCGSLSVTTRYLIQRIPGMTDDAAEELISLLKQAGHIESVSAMLRVDPTRSEWRRIVSPNNSTHWLNIFDLKPGYSPLAKALHRAWAFHEYCSEAIVPALNFFEGHKVNM